MATPLRMQPMAKCTAADHCDFDRAGNGLSAAACGGASVHQIGSARKSGAIRTAINEKETEGEAADEAFGAGDGAIGIDADCQSRAAGEAILVG